MKLTKHAKVRSNQRGIPKYLIELILACGSPTRKPGNAWVWRITKGDKIRIIAVLKDLIQQLDKIKDVGVLEGQDGGIITVYHDK